jgi:hypothetical protein
MRNASSILIGTLEGSDRLGDIDLRELEINIKIELRDKGYESVGWINLVIFKDGVE